MLSGVCSRLRPRGGQLAPPRLACSSSRHSWNILREYAMFTAYFVMEALLDVGVECLYNKVSLKN